MNTKERKHLKRMKKLRKREKKQSQHITGRIITYSKPDGDVPYIRAYCGNGQQEFHQRHFDSAEAMVQAAVDWLTAHGTRQVSYEERPMTGKQHLVEAMMGNFLFVDIVKFIATEAEGLDRWQDFDAEYLLPEIAEVCDVDVSYVQGIFEKISAAFSPMSFCELAAAEDRPEAFVSDPTLLTPLNDGFNRIVDAVYGTTRADRLVAIKL